MNRNTTLAAMIGLPLFCFTALAGSVPFANLSLSADTPYPGGQELKITNETGANGCSVVYPVCDNIDITNWTLTVDYTSTYYNGTGPSLASPYVLQWAGSTNDLLPLAPLTVDFDLCGSTGVGDCSAASTQITEVDFSGTIAPGSFALFDPTANEGAGGPGAQFFADPAFTASLIVSSGFPGDYFESVDATLTDQLPSTPEPGSATLSLIAIAAAVSFRKRARAAGRGATHRWHHPFSRAWRP